MRTVKTSKAFTIIELLVATTIIGIIAASTFASFAHQRLVARNSQRKDVATTYTKAIGGYEASNGTSFIQDKDASDISGCTSASPSIDDGTQQLKGTNTTKCVGLDGRSYGRMSADSNSITGTIMQLGSGDTFDLGGSYSNSGGESILTALQKLGFLGTISPDPSLPSTVTPNTQIKVVSGTGSTSNTLAPILANEPDYLLIRCCKDGRESMGTGGSVFAVWTRLEKDGPAQPDTNSGECGSFSAASTVAATYPTFTSGYTYSFGGGLDSNNIVFAPKTSSGTTGGNESGDWFAVGNATAQRSVGIAEKCNKSA